VPSLDDWEKEWGKAEGRMKNAEWRTQMRKPKVVPVDFGAAQAGAVRADKTEIPVATVVRAN
jgi:hypothetical protein